MPEDQAVQTHDAQRGSTRRRIALSQAPVRAHRAEVSLGERAVEFTGALSTRAWLGPGVNCASLAHFGATARITPATHLATGRAGSNRTRSTARTPTRSVATCAATSTQ